MCELAEINECTIYCVYKGTHKKKQKTKSLAKKETKFFWSGTAEDLAWEFA